MAGLAPGPIGGAMFDTTRGRLNGGYAVAAGCAEAGKGGTKGGKAAFWLGSGAAAAAGITGGVGGGPPGGGAAAATSGSGSGWAGSDIRT